MQDTGIKNSHWKLAVIGLVSVVIISTAFMLLAIWENKQGRFPETNTENENVTYQGQDYVYNDKIETFLVLGLDRTEDETDPFESGVQADFLLLIVFDNEAKQSTAIQINRDTMTRVNKLSIGGTSVVDSYTRQIALAYNYVDDDNDKIRSRNTKESVEYLLHGIKIDHYLSLTMDFIAASCDLVGGVEVTVLDDFTGLDSTLAEGETVLLNGEQAHLYVRARQSLENGTNISRMKRQQQYIKALYNKLTTCMEEDSGFAMKLVESLDDYVVYDSSDHKMRKFVDKLNEYEFTGIRDLPGQSRVGEEFMEFYPDEDALWQTVIDLFYKPADSDTKQ